MFTACGENEKCSCIIFYLFALGYSNGSSFLVNSLFPFFSSLAIHFVSSDWLLGIELTSSIVPTR